MTMDEDEITPLIQPAESPAAGSHAESVSGTGAGGIPLVDQDQLTSSPDQLVLNFAKLLQSNNLTILNSLPTDWDAGVKPPAWVTETLSAADHRIEPLSSGYTFENCAGLKIHYRKILPDIDSSDGLAVYVHGMGSHCNKHR